jgi:hypothetical protein
MNSYTSWNTEHHILRFVFVGELSIFLAVKWVLGTSVTVRSTGRLGQTEWLPRNFLGAVRGGGWGVGAGLQVKTKNSKFEILSPKCVLTSEGKMSSLVFLSCWSVCNMEPTLNSDTTWWCVGLKMMQELQQYSIPFMTYTVIWYCVLNLQSPCMLSYSGKTCFGSFSHRCKQ